MSISEGIIKHIKKGQTRGWDLCLNYATKEKNPYTRNICKTSNRLSGGLQSPHKLAHYSWRSLVSRPIAPLLPFQWTLKTLLFRRARPRDILQSRCDCVSSQYHLFKTEAHCMMGRASSAAWLSHVSAIVWCVFLCPSIS